MVPMIINHRSRNLSNDRHIQEAISNRHTSLSQGDIDTNNYFSSAFTCTGTGGWAPTVAAQRINDLGIRNYFKMQKGTAALYEPFVKAIISGTFELEKSCLSLCGKRTSESPSKCLRYRLQ